jgi:hypothetical protein
MFKRTFWFSSGVVVGAGSTVWATIRLRQAAAQVTPGGLADQALTRARRAGTDVREAVAEGRLTMRETEALLRRELEPPSIERDPLRGIEAASAEAAVVESGASRSRARALLPSRSARNGGRAVVTGRHGTPAGPS